MRGGHVQGTFAWGLALYRQSQAWAALSHATQRQRSNIFKHIEAALGDSKLWDWKRGGIAAGRDKRAATPAAAGMSVKALRGFFGWALEAGHVTTNPTEGVKIVEVATEGFEPWTDDDVAAYRACWPLGTRQRVAFEVFRTWANEAGVGKSAHGLRNAAATADAMDGYSDAELDAKFGWTQSTARLRRLPPLACEAGYVKRFWAGSIFDNTCLAGRRL
jgi:hypothetical protein